jgi:hypothetical protein
MQIFLAGISDDFEGEDVLSIWLLAAGPSFIFEPSVELFCPL